MKSFTLRSTSDAHLVHRLSLAGARCQLLVAKTASTLWANLVLKRRDTVLAKVKDSISYESFMDPLNARLSSSTELQTSWRQRWRSFPGSYMMRPFLKLFPWISLNRSVRKSSIFRSRLSSSNSGEVFFPFGSFLFLIIL